MRRDLRFGGLDPPTAVAQRLPAWVRGDLRCGHGRRMTKRSRASFAAGEESVTRRFWRFHMNVTLR